jgi:hypothetical protein
LPPQAPRLTPPYSAEGVVGSEMDKNMANVQANSVSGVFSVTNNLEVDKG